MKEMKGKKVVVTGGAGFIGSHLVDALIEKGANVHVIDNLSGGKRVHVNEKSTFHNIDIRNADSLRSIISNSMYVFHTAALPRVQYSIEHPLETSEINVGGTINVLVAAKEAGVRRVIFSASSSAYGNQEKMPLREDMNSEPLSPYGLQKYMGEQLCRLWSKMHNLSTVSLRYFNVYGPRYNPEGEYALVIGKFLKQKEKGEPMTITGDGEQTRDFTHVLDVVRANLLAAESNKVGYGEVINIGGGRNYSINQIARLIGGPTIYIPSRLEPKHTLADITKAKELLKWEPQITLEEGLQMLTVEHDY